MPAATVLFLAEASTRKPLSQLIRPLGISLLSFRPAGYTFPVTFRRTGTDRAVLRQMLLTQEYGPAAALSDVRLIVDCGANIRVSGYYFLHRYPAARLVAVEPDAQNCALCRRNLSPFGDRAIVLQAALWPECRPLRIVPASRALGAWRLRVEPADAESADVEGLTIPEILRRAGAAPPIDLLKIDIEGSETELFRRTPEALGLARNIAIELHGPDAEAAFSDALRPYHYDRREADELTIIYGLKRVDPAPP